MRTLAWLLLPGLIGCAKHTYECRPAVSGVAVRAYEETPQHLAGVQLRACSYNPFQGGEDRPRHCMNLTTDGEGRFWVPPVRTTEFAIVFGETWERRTWYTLIVGCDPKWTSFGHSETATDYALPLVPADAGTPLHRLCTEPEQEHAHWLF